MPVTINIGRSVRTGSQDHPLRPVRGSYGGLQVPSRGRDADRADKEKTDALLIGASYFAKEYNANAKWERDKLRESAEGVYLETLAQQQAQFPDSPETWRSNAMEKTQTHIDNGTSKSHPVMDFLFNDTRANEDLSNYATKINAGYAHIEQQGIVKKKIRSIETSMRTFSQNIARRTNMAMETDEMSGVQYYNPRLDNFEKVVTESEVALSNLIDKIDGMVGINAETKKLKVDKLIREWGMSLTGVMQKWHPKALNENIRRLNHIFSEDFFNGEYTDHFDQDYQKKRFQSLGELARIQGELNKLKVSGTGQKAVNDLLKHTTYVEEVLKDGNPSPEERDDLFKKTESLLDNLKAVRIAGTIKDPETGLAVDKPFVDDKRIQQIGERIYDALFFPVQQKLLRHLETLSRDKTPGSAFKALREMTDDKNVAGSWRFWRTFISQKKRESFLRQSQAFVSAEDKKTAAREEIGRTRNLNSLADILTRKERSRLIEQLKHGALAPDPDALDGQTVAMDVELFEKNLIESERRIRNNLGNAGESPEVINNVISKHFEQIAYESPTLKEFVREYGITRTADTEVNQSFEIAMSTLMTSRGSLKALLSANNEANSEADRILKDQLKTENSAIKSAIDQDTYINPEAFLKRYRDILTKYSDRTGTDSHQGMANLNIFRELISIHNFIVGANQHDRNIFDQSVLYHTEGKDIHTGGFVSTSILQSRINKLVEADNMIGDVLASRAKLGQSMRRVIFGEGASAGGILSAFQNRIRTNLSMQRKFLSAADPNEPFGNNPIKKEDLINHLGLLDPPTERERSIAIGDFGGSMETWQSSTTRLEIILGSVKDGTDVEKQSAYKFLSLFPGLADDFTAIYKRAINGNVLRSPDGWKTINAFARSADTLISHSIFSGSDEKEDSFLRYAQAWQFADSLGLGPEEGWKRAQAIVSHLDEKFIFDTGPMGSISHVLKTPEKINGFINKVVKRFTHDIESAYKDMGVIDNVAATDALRYNIALLMQRPIYATSDRAETEGASPTLAQREEYLADALYETLHNAGFITVDRLSVPKLDSVFKTRLPGETGIQAGLNVTWKTRNAGLSIGGAAHQLKGTELQQFISTHVAAGRSDSANRTADAHAELMMVRAMEEVLYDAIQKKESPRAALQPFSFKDIQYAFKGNIGLSRDVALRMIDEAVWDYEGVPHEKRPDLINYNIGHPMSVFGFHKASALKSTKITDAAAFDDMSRDKFRILQDDGTKTNKSNMQIIATMVQGKIWADPENNRSSSTILIRRGTRWTPMGEVFDELEEMTGVTEAAKMQTVLAAPEVRVLHNVQIPVEGPFKDGRGALTYEWTKQWKKGVLSSNESTPDGVALYYELSVPKLFYGMGKNVRSWKVNVPATQTSYKLYKDHIYDQHGYKWLLKDGSYIPPAPWEMQELEAAEDKSTLESAGEIIKDLGSAAKSWWEESEQRN